MLIGEEKMGDTIAVSNSRKAVNRFRELLKDTDEFTIEVRESTPHDWS